MSKSRSFGVPPGGSSGSSDHTYTDEQTATRLAKAANLSDVADTSSSRSNIGLGNASTRDVGTTAGTVAAGDDSRITGAAQKTANLSDLGSASTARTNLGLGGAALLNVGTVTGTVAAGDDTRIAGAAQKTANLSDLGNTGTARTNLGLGGAATLNVGTTAGTVAAGNDSRVTGAAQKTANLSDLSSVSTARGNLGLGGAALLNVGAVAGTVAAGDDTRLSDTRTPTDGSVTNAKVASGAAIALSKLAVDPLARANHTGTQTASTISDFDTRVTTSRLDQMAAPTSDLNINSHRLTSLADPSTGTDATTKQYVDGIVGVAPVDHGLLAWNHDPSLSVTSQAPTAGSVYLVGVFIRKSVSATKLWFANAAAATSITAGQSFIGLYNSTGSLLASAGIDTQIQAAANAQSATITSTALTPGMYWIALLMNFSGGLTLMRGSNGGHTNVNLATSVLRFAINGTTQTALSSSITPASNTKSGSLPWWVAIS